MALNRFNMNEMNKTFNEMTMAYLDVCSNLHILDNVNDDIIDNNVNKISACINDLLINLQLLKFNIENIQYNEQLPTSEKPHSPVIENSDANANANANAKNEKLVNKTIKDLLPLFMTYMMSIDNNSIINTLSENANILEPVQFPEISKSNAQTPFQAPETLPVPKQLPIHHNHNMVDDVD